MPTVRPNSTQFYLWALRHYSWIAIHNYRHTVARLFRRVWRTTAYSVVINDEARQRLRERVLNAGLDREQLYEAICYLKGTTRFLLMADRVVQGDESVVEAHLYDQLYGALGLSKESQSKVLEFGCGHGRNLFWLKENHPELSLFGADISPVSIDLCRELSKLLDLDVQFDNLSDHTLPFSDDFFDVVFTNQCIEQCPSTYKQIIQEILRVTKKSVVFLEPMNELHGYSVRGLLNRVHAGQNNYAQGVYSYLKTVATVRTAHRLRWAANPAWEACLVVVDKRDTS